MLLNGNCAKLANFENFKACLGGPFFRGHQLHHYLWTFMCKASFNGTWDPICSIYDCYNISQHLCHRLSSSSVCEVFSCVCLLLQLWTLVLLVLIETLVRASYSSDSSSPSVLLVNRRLTAIKQSCSCCGCCVHCARQRLTMFVSGGHFDGKTCMPLLWNVRCALLFSC